MIGKFTPFLALAVFAQAQSGLPAPRILSPNPVVNSVRPDATHPVAIPVRIQWATVTGGLGHRAEIYPHTGITETGPLITANNLTGAVATTTFDVQPGRYKAVVRACDASFAAAGCGAASDVYFEAIAASTRIQAPAHGSVITQSTTLLRWQAMAGAADYRLRLFRNGALFVSDSFPASILGAPYTLPSGFYRMFVNDDLVEFEVKLGAVPTGQPTISSATVSNGNSLTTAFTSVTGADLYYIQVIQQGAGPGGGALTVAAKMVQGSPVTLPVPSGAAAVVVSACNADGCAPHSASFNVQVPGPSPTTPIIGTPAAGPLVSGPSVFFSWSRVPGDNGSNTTYRLYVQDMGRQRPALDVYTTSNFWAANMRPGIRYDALAIANPGAGQVVGPPNGFVVQGASPASPAPAQPGYNEVVKLGGVEGSVNVEWGPVDHPWATYQVTLVSDGPSPHTFTANTALGVTAVNARLQAGRRYTGIVRACLAVFNGTSVRDTDCTQGISSWSPWSDAGGTGSFAFSTVQ